MRADHCTDRLAQCRFETHRFEILARRSLRIALRIGTPTGCIRGGKQFGTGRAELRQTIEGARNTRFVQRDGASSQHHRLATARCRHRLHVEAIARDLGPHVGLQRMHPRAAEFERVAFVLCRVRSTAQSVARLHQHGTPAAHREFARGRHTGETAADDDDIRDRRGRRGRSTNRSHAGRNDRRRAPLQNVATRSHFTLSHVSFSMHISAAPPRVFNSSSPLALG